MPTADLGLNSKRSEPDTAFLPPSPKRTRTDKEDAHEVGIAETNADIADQADQTGPPCHDDQMAETRVAFGESTAAEAPEDMAEARQVGEGETSVPPATPRASLKASARGTPKQTPRSTSKATAAKASTVKGTTPKGATPSRATPRGASAKAATSRGATPRGAASKGAASKGASAKGADPKDETPGEDVAGEESLKGATPRGVTPKAKSTPKSRTTPKSSASPQPRKVGNSSTRKRKSSEPAQLTSDEEAAAVKVADEMFEKVDDSWREMLRDILISPEGLRVLDKYEKACRKSVKVFPPRHLVLNAFAHTKFEDTKVVILGQDPYHREGQAMGLAFSVPRGVGVPPSLKKIYEEVGLKGLSHGDLSGWCDQGVLLLNPVLTVEESKAASHQNMGWQLITDAVLQRLSQTHPKSLVFMLWGNKAQAKTKLLDEDRHLILTAAHPSPLATKGGFLGCRHFELANEHLTSKGYSPIAWDAIRDAEEEAAKATMGEDKSAPSEVAPTEMAPTEGASTEMAASEASHTQASPAAAGLQEAAPSEEALSEKMNMETAMTGVAQMTGVAPMEAAMTGVAPIDAAMTGLAPMGSTAFCGIERRGAEAETGMVESKANCCRADGSMTTTEESSAPIAPALITDPLLMANATMSEVSDRTENEDIAS